MIEKPECIKVEQLASDFREGKHLELDYYRKSEIDKYIDALRMETVEMVVDDFTRWRKCDPVTGAPGEEYFKPHHKMVLVKVKFNYLGEDTDIVRIATWRMCGNYWKFICDEDPLNERESSDQFKVVGWRPIH